MMVVIFGYEIVSYAYDLLEAWSFEGTWILSSNSFLRREPLALW